MRRSPYAGQPRTEHTDLDQQPGHAAAEARQGDQGCTSARGGAASEAGAARRLASEHADLDEQPRDVAGERPGQAERGGASAQGGAAGEEGDAGGPPPGDADVRAQRGRAAGGPGQVRRELDEASVLFEEELHACREMLGDGHQSTLSSIQNLADLRQEQAASISK
eukprot:scaffold44018_cov70-Phaeocystis_antarctica.AAC.8